MMLSVVFLVLGLIVGSFLNVLVCRLKDAETILGRSFCRACKHQIRWYDNIPLLSFLLLRGQCRDCKERISWQYPALEFLTAALFALVGRYFFSIENQSAWLETGWLLVVVSCFVVIAAYDLRHMEIPIIVLLVSGIITVLFLGSTLCFDTGSLGGSRAMLGLAGGIAVSAFFFALVFVSRETWMGWGDVWLGLVAGMIVGLPAALFMLTASFASGAIIGIASIYFGGKGMKSQIPFAPFIVFGVLFTLFFPRVFPQYAMLFFL